MEIKPKRQVLEIPIEPLHGRINRAIKNTYQLKTKTNPQKQVQSLSKKRQIFIKIKATQMVKSQYNPQKTLKNPRLQKYMRAHVRNQ